MKKFFLILRLILGLFFIASSILKQVSINAFIESIKSYDIFPISLVQPISFFICVIELLLGFMIFFNIYGKTAVKLALFLMFIFICFVTYGLIAQKEWTCNCFGQLFTQKINYLTLIRNLIILGIAILVSLKFSEQFTYEKLKYKNIILTLIIIINLTPFLYRKLFPQMSSLKIGDKIELKSKSVDKKDVDLSDRTEPYAILFVFSLDDCTSCLEEALYWEKLKNKFQSKIKLFAIAYSHNFLLLKSFINHKGITFPVIWDREKDIIKS